MQKIEAASPEAQSANLVANNVAQLKALFPELVTEGPNGPAVNVDVLKALVGDATVTDAEEKYGLNWHGKRAARQLALTPSTGTLRPCPDESVDWDTTKNLMIEGDNLEVLKLLQKSYAGKVKLIYIDPPYNTGKDFVYPDSFQDSIRNYLELTGQAEGGRKISSNTEASGRFHTDWLNMMYARLRVARTLLRPDGYLLLSIDDTEFANVRQILAELFGEECLIGSLIHQRAKGGGQARHIVKGHDYILVVARDSEKCAPLRRDKVVQGRTQFIDGKEFLIDDDVVRKQFGKYDKSDGDRRCFYEQLESYKGVEKKLEIDQKLASGEYFLHQWENGMHAICRRIPLDEASSKLYSIVKVLSEEGKKDLESLQLADVFSYPKPVELISQLVRAATSGDDCVLDFFAGSGTTAHAVISQNALDSHSRRFICVQLPEPLDPSDKAQKAGAALCDKLKKPRNIAELTKERIRRAATKVKAENPLFGGDVGFRVFKLDSSNIRAWNAAADGMAETLLAHAEHLLPDRTDDDVLAELLLKLGLDLCVPMQARTVAGKQLRSVAGGVLIACLDPQIQASDVEPLAQGIIAWHKELAPAGDTTCVFRDSAFADDVAKTNMAAILEQNGIANVRSL
ncbi:MAG: site-specific DNA-methyltransferase [Burkholderiales bacterium]|nr:site-specific DNA-methyltransferase [Burkholderiales bacterium]